MVDDDKPNRLSLKALLTATAREPYCKELELFTNLIGIPPDFEYIHWAFSGLLELTNETAPRLPIQIPPKNDPRELISRTLTFIRLNISGSYPSFDMAPEGIDDSNPVGDETKSVPILAALLARPPSEQLAYQHLAWLLLAGCIQNDHAGWSPQSRDSLAQKLKQVATGRESRETQLSMVRPVLDDSLGAKLRNLVAEEYRNTKGARTSGIGATFWEVLDKLLRHVTFKVIKTSEAAFTPAAVLRDPEKTEVFFLKTAQPADLGEDRGILAEPQEPTPLIQADDLINESEIDLPSIRGSSIRVSRRYDARRKLSRASAALLNPIERMHFMKKWASSLKEESHDILTTDSLQLGMLQYILGITSKDYRDIVLGGEPSDDAIFWISDDGMYCRKIVAPPNAVQVSLERAEWQDQVATEILLPLPIILSQWLTTMVHAHRGKTIHEVFPDRKYEEKFFEYLAKWREGKRYRLKAGKISAQLEAQLICNECDELSTYLLSSKKYHIPPTIHYYRAITVEKLKNIWRSALQELTLGLLDEK